MPESNPPDETRCAVFLKALADPLRLQMVRALQRGPLSVSDLAEMLEQEMGMISHHLRVLYHADLVVTERDGKFIYYSLSDKFFAERGKSHQGSLDFGCCKFEIGPPPP